VSYVLNTHQFPYPVKYELIDFIHRKAELPIDRVYRALYGYADMDISADLLTDMNTGIFHGHIYALEIP
jgi:hypothetical protein